MVSAQHKIYSIVWIELLEIQEIKQFIISDAYKDAVNYAQELMQKRHRIPIQY
jgi:hypothetical protein